jgi:hypothetical protein
MVFSRRELTGQMVLSVLPSARSSQENLSNINSQPQVKLELSGTTRTTVSIHIIFTTH